MYQVHNIPNKTQYLTLIDKCTQILRQDRIWLRNMLKANNQDVVYLFKGLPKNFDMKQLQIKLRKYIMRAKERQKQQQLQRFKQNMHLPDFIQAASQKRQQTYINNKSQTKLAQGPLKQSQANEPKSSFVAKWNNYTHYNQSIHMEQNRSHYQQQPSSMHGQNRSANKQWSNNYKPHSFNKSLNGQLSNKLSSKNKSVSQFNRHNKSSTSLTKEKSNIIKSRFHNNEEVQEINQSNKYPLGGGRNSSKSLKQLQNKIYQELRLFQLNKTKKQTQNLNKTYSQRSVQRFTQKQKVNTNFPQTQKAATLSKQNIDQILKFKLGNCDYESYRKSHESENQDQPEQTYKETTTSQKKLYHEGLFPPIQEQTERDSESQRYPEEPLRFGLNIKPQVQDRHKVTFASFAKASPNQTFKSYDLSEAKMISSTTNNIHEFNEYQRLPHQIKSPASITKSFGNVEYEQPHPHKKISQSLYQSAEKKSDTKDNYIQSDLHQSIMQSIKKSRQMFPEAGYSNNSNKALQNSQSQIRNILTSNFHTQKPLELPAPRISSQIASFQSSLYSSTHDDQCLFTSPQLLNECRNFLKKTQQINFENSGLKQMTGSIPLSKFQSPSNSQQKSFKQTFNNFSNTGIMNFPQPITITESITKEFYDSNSQARINSLFQSKQSSVSKINNIEFQTYSKPEYIDGEDSSKKSEFAGSSIMKSDQMNEIYEQQSTKKGEVMVYSHSRKNSSMKKHSQIEETIALPTNPVYFNLSNNSKQQKVLELEPLNEQNFKTSQFATLARQESSRKVIKNEEPIGNLIDLEDVIDKILQANEGNIEVDSTWLKHTINNRCIFEEEVGSVLKTILKSYIGSDNTYNFIEIINTVEKEYRKNPNYQPRKSPSRDICSLLDIEQKGFITFEDIQNFVSQLQNAGVDHIEGIAQHLQEVFEIGDFMGVKQISYINLYIIKNEDCFENLWNYLQEFEFQISAEQ